jgi:glycosyltransferase involved in cell wall biosynthesis
MRRIAVVEYLMSAGGVERVIRGLARSFLSLPEARRWDITFLLARYNSAGIRCDWPAELTGSNLHIEWIDERTRLSRALGRMARGEGIRGLPGTRRPGHLASRLIRRLGPLSWRASLGDPFAVVSAASRRFDLLYFPYPFLMRVPPLHVPVVTTPQDFNFKHFLAEGSRARQSQERFTHSWLERADRVLLSSEAVRQELLRFYPQYESKSEVIRLGIDVDSAPSTPEKVEEVRRAYSLPRRFALVTGWVMPHKNQLTVVRAITQLRQKGIDLPVVFAGPNSAKLVGAASTHTARNYVDEVRDALRDAGLAAGHDFHALGYVSDEDIQALYRMATVFVCPSTYEGFGLPGLEAMLAGCPVLLSSIPPLDEQNRLLGGIIRMFEPNDAASLALHIEWFLSHPDEARAIARLAAERVSSVYDWSMTARAYLAAFEDVLSRAEPSRRVASAG